MSIAEVSCNEKALTNKKATLSIQVALFSIMQYVSRNKHQSVSFTHRNFYLSPLAITCDAALITAAIRPTSRNCVVLMPSLRNKSK